jgi:hypothetical protein
VREHDVEVALPRSSADLWPLPSTHGRSRRACACLPGCMIVRDARRWEATWTCSELIMGHASWLRYRSPMASMMAAVSTVRTMMTTWRAGATHPHASAGRRGDSGAAGTWTMPQDSVRRRGGAKSGLVLSRHQPPDLRPHAPSTNATVCIVERTELAALSVLTCITQQSFFMI